MTLFVGGTNMNARELSERMRIEHEIVAHVRQAMAIAAEAPITSVTAMQWVERFAFLGNSLYRHFRRLFAIEEEGGYMEFLVNCPRPTLGNHADALCAQHQQFLGDLEGILRDAAVAQPEILANLHNLRQRLVGLLKRFDSHRRSEYDLWIEAHYIDIGGEG